MGFLDRLIARNLTDVPIRDQNTVGANGELGRTIGLNDRERAAIADIMSVRTRNTSDVVREQFRTTRGAVGYEPMESTYRTGVSAIEQEYPEGLREFGRRDPVPKLPQINSITAEKILSTMPCCLYGSRGIGLENADDYDIAISIEDPKYLEFINYLERAGVKRVDIKNYASSTPESGYYGLYRFQGAKGEGLDLLVLYLDEDVDVIRSTITDLKRIPSYFLTNKPQRITMYNQGLRYRGWKEGVKVREEFVRELYRASSQSFRDRPTPRRGPGFRTSIFGPSSSESWDF